MKLFLDYFPILLFFITYKLFHNIYLATGVTMLASVLQVSAYWLVHRRFEKLHVVTLVLVLILGGATLLFHDELFIKWKPTAIYWTFATIFLLTHFIGKKTFVERLMDEHLTLPQAIWQRLNLSWAIFFSVMGIANLYVLYHYSTDTWVNFKLFGTLGLMLAFVFAQVL